MAQMGTVNQVFPIIVNFDILVNQINLSSNKNLFRKPLACLFLVAAKSELITTASLMANKRLVISERDRIKQKNHCFRLYPLETVL